MIEVISMWNAQKNMGLHLKIKGNILTKRMKYLEYGQNRDNI